MMRRTKEFDKPDLLSDISFNFNQDHHTVLPSNDAYRAHRKLLQDLMAPAFLRGVTAPQLHVSFMDLINLWREKLRPSHSRPFSTKEDAYNTALEAIYGPPSSASMKRLLLHANKSTCCQQCK